MEIERFEWAAPNRIEIVGHWTGLHGRRFMRPTLVLKGEGDPKRLLALLEHKPWAASDGEEWIAAFAWDGPVVKFEGAELNVGSGIDLDLPSPRMRPGKPRRFRQRVVARDASRDADPVAPRAEGIVSDPPTVPEEEPKLSRAEALKRAKEAATAATHPKPAANAAKAAPRPDPDPTIAMDAAVADQPAAADPDVPAVTDAPEPADVSGELESARADVERLRAERDGLRRERDQALEKLRRVRAEVEAERQARERAVADARAEERESANRMLGQGAELRAAVERQREIAYLERDDAFSARDAAITARDKACDERDGALAEARQARRDRKEAFAQRDHAVKLRERAETDRAKAVAARDEALAEREAAVKEHDEVLRAHERGLPVHPPKPRYLPESHQHHSELERWAPRAFAIGLLIVVVFILLRLLGGL